MTTTTEVPAPPEPVAELDLLVWDAPNVDMTLSNVIGGRPTPTSRPRFDAVARWLLSAAADREVEGAVFANVPPGGAVTMRGWIEAIRSFGYAVFARPKLGPEDDVDADMLHHIAKRARTHRLRRLVVASGDGRNFLDPLEELARAGVEVVVLSFAEVAGLRAGVGGALVRRPRGRAGRLHLAAAAGSPGQPARGWRVAAADPADAGPLGGCCALRPRGRRATDG
jgi:uncharacterized protein